MEIMQPVGQTPAFGNLYVMLWSAINFLMLAVMVAVPIVCVYLLVKMNRRLGKLEEQVSKMEDGGREESQGMKYPQ